MPANPGSARWDLAGLAGASKQKMRARLAKTRAVLLCVTVDFASPVSLDLGKEAGRQGGPRLEA